MVSPTSSTVSAPAPPVADWVTLEDLDRDPYPTYRQLREQSAIHWVPAMNRYLVTGFDACHQIDNDQETFTANEEGSLQKIAMGHSLLRKDDPEHAYERKGFGNVLKPRAIKEHWTGIFQKNADTFLNKFEDLGPGADLMETFATPYTAENLRHILGFENSTYQDVLRWSQDMIDGTANYADDPEVWSRCKKAFDDVDDAIDEMVPVLRKTPNASLLSQFLAYEMPMESVRANIKLSIGGGQNEPRDILGTLIWALLSNPEQESDVREDPSLWMTAFEEAIRWVAPIGMYSRQATREVDIAGVRLPAGAKLGINVGAANRDPAQFEDPETFNIHRKRLPHLAFGTGAHFCAGNWIAKAMVANVAAPEIFRRFPDLKLDPDNKAVPGGWVFRGMRTLPLVW